MFLIIFIVIILGLFITNTFTPIAEFLIDAWIYILILLCISCIIYAVYVARKHKSMIAGIGVFLSFSQFWAVALAGICAIADVLTTENDAVLSSIIGIIVGAILLAYILFNRNMVSSAYEVCDEHPCYPLIVGIAGWGINIAFMLL